MEKKVKAVAADKKQMTRLVKDNNSVLILVALLLVAFILVDGFTKGFYNVFIYAAEYGAICLGLGLVMITGNIDLSVGFLAGVAGVATVMSFNAVYAATGNALLAIVAGLVCALVTGAVCGLLNGFVITKIGVSPLIATIATNYIFKGVVFMFAKSSYPLTDSAAMQVISKTKIGGMRWLTPMVIFFFVLIAIFFLWMYKTKFGNRLHVVGDNPEAAAYAGISVPTTVLVTYIVCGVLAAVTGFLMVSYDGYAIYTQGNAMATFPISCCVIGGVKMAGGKGTAIHVMIGVLIMRTIQTMMNCMFLSPAWVNFITGVLLIVILLVNRLTSAKNADD